MTADPRYLAALFANVEARPKRRQGITGQTIEAMMRGTMCQITEYELDALRDEIARLQEAVNAEEMRANENKARAEKAEAALSESQAREAMLHRAITEASDPDFIWGAMDNVHDMDTGLEEFAEAASRAIRAAVPTPANAQAALDARDRAKVEEGYLIAMAEAKKLGAYIVAPEHCPAILAKIKEAEK